MNSSYLSVSHSLINTPTQGFVYIVAVQSRPEAYVTQGQILRCKGFVVIIRAQGCVGGSLSWWEDHICQALRLIVLTPPKSGALCEVARNNI